MKLKYRKQLAETSSGFVRYQDEERPLVGSLRDINPAIFEVRVEPAS